MNLRSFWSADFSASVVVFLVALPLCLGIALASGAPLFSGILAGVVGGVIVGSLSGSQLSVSGPAAGLSTIVFASILELGYPAFLLSVVLAGALQIVLGLLRAGTIGHFFPASVIKGMLAGIGLILILKQIPHAVGFDADFEGDESFFQQDGRNTFSEIIESFNYISAGAVIISIVSVLILIFWNSDRLMRYKFFRVVPAPLVVVIVGILLNRLYTLVFPDLVIKEEHFVTLPSLSDSTGLAAFLTIPDFSYWQDPSIYTIAITLAIVASLETLLSIEAVDKMDPIRRITPLNRELNAQGIGNIISGFLGGLPITSVIVRSSANVNAGAHSKASTISHGIILMISVLVIPGTLQLIPLSCLAGILLVTGYKLSKPSSVLEIYKKGLGQFLPFMATVLAVVFTNLLQGVLIGVVVALFFILKASSQQAIIVVSDPDGYLIKFTKDITFLHKAELRHALSKIPRETQVTFDATKASFIDADIIETIEDFMENAKAKNISVDLEGIAILQKISL